ncbi:MAG: efflux RND transporter periplasmic adaptor subunit [Cyclobacteriaceae bacterium]|nr:efflux RND transporter periplasmic adaptor subunit [Cyclobacteriaceae bacterium]
MKIQLTVHTLLLIIIIGIASCSTSNEKSTVEETTTIAPEDDSYTISTSQFNTAKMEFGEMVMSPFHQSIKSNGIFDVPPENKASVSAYFGGYVKEIHLLPGEKVKKGQMLFVLENPDYVQVQQEFLEAKGKLSYLKSDYERQKNLAQENITSQKNYLKAEAEYTITQVKYESLKKKLRLMNINAERLTYKNIRTVMSVLSPINGYVTEVGVTKGMYIAPADVGITIVDTDHMHLELSVFEKDLSQISIGQPIKFKTQGNTSQVFDASVYLVNKSIDAEKRTVVVHGHLKDEKTQNGFTPGMYIESEILTATKEKLAVPEETIVEMEGKYYVLIKKENLANGFKLEKREINIGESTDNFIEIVNHSEFKNDTQFLTKGAFNLITE